MGEQQNAKIMNSIQNLYDNGKISSDELEKLKNKVQESISQSKNIMEDKKLQNLNKNIDQQLQEALSTSDYESINDEIEILNGLIESNSDISSVQEKNVLNKL